MILKSAHNSDTVFELCFMLGMCQHEPKKTLALSNSLQYLL